MNGLEICRRLRKEQATHHTPIVIITAKVVPNDISKSVGANYYIVKPFSVREVVGQVKFLLNNES